jgi:hypothetical protein
MSFLFFRLPLVDPNAWLTRIKPFIRLLTGPWMAAICAGGGDGRHRRLREPQALVDKSQGLLALATCRGCTRAWRFSSCCTNWGTPSSPSATAARCARWA